MSWRSSTGSRSVRWTQCGDCLTRSPEERQSWNKGIGNGANEGSPHFRFSFRRRDIFCALILFAFFRRKKRMGSKSVPLGAAKDERSGRTESSAPTRCGGRSEEWADRVVRPYKVRGKIVGTGGQGRPPLRVRRKAIHRGKLGEKHPGVRTSGCFGIMGYRQLQPRGMNCPMAPVLTSPRSTASWPRR